MRSKTQNLCTSANVTIRDSVANSVCNTIRNLMLDIDISSIAVLSGSRTCNNVLSNGHCDRRVRAIVRVGVIAMVYRGFDFVLVVTCVDAAHIAVW
jgi:hypothetical protein